MTIEHKRRRRSLVSQALERRRGPVPFHVHLLSAQTKRLERLFGSEDLDAALGQSLAWVSLPKHWVDTEEGVSRDEFGVLWKTNPDDRGHVHRHPYADGVPASVELPPPPTAQDVAQLALEADSRPGYVVAWIGDLFERAHFLRGLEGILTDFYLDAEGADRLLDALADRIAGTMRALADTSCDAFFLSDDYGSQNALLMRPETWRRFIAPRLERIASESHSLGRPFFLHSCGCVMEILGDLASVGVDVLHPVQPECQDVFELARVCGNTMTLYGGIGTQEVLRKASPDEVRQTVRTVAAELGAEGGYILAPSISLMADVPQDNVRAFLEVAWELAGEDVRWPSGQ